MPVSVATPLPSAPGTIPGGFDDIIQAELHSPSFSEASRSYASHCILLLKSADFSGMSLALDATNLLAKNWSNLSAFLRIFSQCSTKKYWQRLVLAIPTITEDESC
jgi:hypothetical protein